MSKVIKNGRSKKYTINGKKLAKALEKKGLVPRELSAALAFHPGYLGKCIRTNTIGEHAIGMLMNYGIAPSKYDAEILTKEKTVGDIFDSLPEETKEEVYSEVEEAIEESEKAPVEKALEEPGVVKIELTLDMVKLKAIVKQAVKEAYEEL